ncbi:response regulator transcription factor [Pelagicoccus sp. SDUM812002]|uniref:response regulator transcription factor n=1 Tax=Pelagicoccus sp. SDUM812002 TaxID=3041266 RepID=UPI00280CC3E0|nr:response regulator transcription factor [Pelagicoccus sp. SDUM812002]MDQ8185992.1 response regulator transcription factor [Pelagicoccus sp. SDUM812002]
MSKKRILVAEDDPHIRTGLVDTLESEGYLVVATSDGNQASSLFPQDTFDLALLDIMMPGKDGYSLCQEFRAKSPQTAIIHLTAKSQEIDKVLGLKLGADDYITKPFGVQELLARIEAIFRRTGSQAKNDKTTELPSKLTIGPLTINRSTYKLEYEGQDCALTERELKLLEQFYLHPGEVLNRSVLLDRVWGIEYYGTTRTLDQHIAQIRKKMNSLGASDPIETVHGVGYRALNEKASRHF